MKRLQRLRSTPHLRDLTATTSFGRKNLIQPLFIAQGLKEPETIAGLKGTRRLNTEQSLLQIESDLEQGVKQFILFHVPSDKNDHGFHHESAQSAISAIRSRFKDDLCLWVDTCLCSYTLSGHCSITDSLGKTSLESTWEEISKAALAYVQAGADGVSPSDMIDGTTAAIRSRLDQNGYDLTPIMSYSTKFASAMYGPFRNAAQSSPKHGDRKHYQIDVRNRLDAIASSLRCQEEGADLLMVKPGMTSIDLIRPIQEKSGLAVGAYQVSGEYAALALLAEHGLGDFENALSETWNVFARAGAQYVITYGARFAKQMGF